MVERVNHNNTLPWEQTGWREEIEGWISATLAQQGITVEGTTEIRLQQPWSTVLSVPTNTSTVYFKATAPMLAHEPRLTAALAEWYPSMLPTVLAADTIRGWLLLADAGTTLREQIHSINDLSHWTRFLPRYAEMQIALADRHDEILALGALDRRLTTLPSAYEALLTDTAILRLDQPDGLTSAEYERLAALVPRFAARCRDLAAFGLPETLHHDDLHDGNVLIRDGRYTLTDWGESGIAHPFFSLLVTLRSIAYRFGFFGEEETRPETTRLRDCYLEPWTAFAPRSDLLTAFTLARQVAMLGRALTWYQLVAALPEPYRSQEADAVPGWLQAFLNSGIAD